MKQGEIYVADLGPGIGREASGVCPVVIISDDIAGLTPLLVVVLPCVSPSDRLAALGTLVTAADSGHSADIVVLTKQPRAIDISRITAGPAGEIPKAVLDTFRFSLQVQLDLFRVSRPPRP